MGTKTTADKLAEAKAKAAKAQAAVRQMQVQLASAERKADSRRKLILGAAVLAKHPDLARQLVEQLTRPQDLAAFEGWTPPAAPAKAGLGERPAGQAQQPQPGRPVLHAQRPHQQPAGASIARPPGAAAVKLF